MDLNKDQKCHAIIHTASAAAAGAGAGLAQIPGSDSALIVPIQIGMVISLGAIFDVALTKSAATAILGTVGTSMVGRGVSQFLVGWIPVIGNTINASTAAAVTEAAGWAAVKYFQNLSDEELKKYQAKKQEGYEQAKAEFDIKLEKIKTELTKVTARMKEYEQMEYFLVGAFAMGIAVANIDGHISKKERETLELLISGISYHTLPDHVKTQIAQLFYQKPTINDALKWLNKVEREHWKAIDELIEILLNLDEDDFEEKQAFREAWNQYYTVA